MEEIDMLQNSMARVNGNRNQSIRSFWFLMHLKVVMQKKEKRIVFIFISEFCCMVFESLIGNIPSLEALKIVGNDFLNWQPFLNNLQHFFAKMC